MQAKNLKLSDTGEKILKEAVHKAREDLKKYGGRLRTTFYFYDQSKKSVQFIELRNYIDEIIKEYDMRFPFSDKDSDYFIFVNMKFFDVLSMRLHRMHPDHYMVVTQKEEGHVVSIIRDAESYPASNVKIAWDDLKLEDGKMEEVEFHLTRKQLQ